MASKGKLEKFREMRSFPNVLQPPFEEVFENDYYLKGKWGKEFFKNDHSITIELGCGKGEYTVGLAKHYPDNNFIGVDIKGARIWKGAKIAINENIKNAGFLRTRVDFIESFFAPDEIKEIWITFPDPQPRKQLKRLTSSRFLNRYRKFLINNGIIHLKTDNADFYHYTKKLAEFNNLPVEFASEDLYNSGIKDTILSIRTYYESVWLEAGLPIHYIRFRIYSGSVINELPDAE